jgi:hypothetical protein
MFEKFDAAGLLGAAEPGWHAARRPNYPQWVEIEFEEPQKISRISLLPQDTLSVRAPQEVVVETSTDGKTWTPVLGIPNACAGARTSGGNLLSSSRSKRSGCVLWCNRIAATRTI